MEYYATMKEWERFLKSNLELFPGYTVKWEKQSAKHYL